MMDSLRLTIVTVLSGFFAYMEPIQRAMFVLLFIFISDMLIAIFTDIAINRNRFNPKKFLTAFFYVAIYLCIIGGIYIVGERMEDTEPALFIDKIITYIFIYFYVINIFKNLRTIAPDNKPIAFIEYTIGLEFMKRIPNLDEWMRRESEGK